RVKASKGQMNGRRMGRQNLSSSPSYGSQVHFNVMSGAGTVACSFSESGSTAVFFVRSAGANEGAQGDKAVATARETHQFPARRGTTAMNTRRW
ncbi:hypothetical protein PMIN02_013107, partial [Paraphaeosphaeria minitans]